MPARAAALRDDGEFGAAGYICIDIDIYICIYIYMYICNHVRTAAKPRYLTSWCALQGVDLETSNQDGDTLLLLVAANPNIDSVMFKQLCNMKAAVNAKNNNASSALHLAATVSERCPMTPLRNSPFTPGLQRQTQGRMANLTGVDTGRGGTSPWRR